MMEARGLDGVGAGPLEQDVLVKTPRVGADSPATPCLARMREGFSLAVDAGA
jgi:hypothetical protein